MKNAERTSLRRGYPGAEETRAEHFLIRPSQPPRTLLPGEMWIEGEGTMLALEPEVSVAGVAGTGGVVLGQEYLLGGWCTFRCRLAVPRRFAASEGARLAAGAPMDGILRGRLSDTLNALLAKVEEYAPAKGAQLKMQLNRQLQDEAQRELMSLGWQVTHCRLEEIRITRR